jgi:hypothetical protein
MFQIGGGNFWNTWAGEPDSPANTHKAYSSKEKSMYFWEIYILAQKVLKKIFTRT